MVSFNGNRSISIQGTVGSSAFQLEISNDSVRRAAALLGIPPGDGGARLMKMLHDLLSSEAFRIALDATGKAEYPWQSQGFEWDAPQQCWNRVYPWRALLHLLAPR